MGRGCLALVSRLLTIKSSRSCVSICAVAPVKKVKRIPRAFSFGFGLDSADRGGECKDASPALGEEVGCASEVGERGGDVGGVALVAERSRHSATTL